MKTVVVVVQEIRISSERIYIYPKRRNKTLYLVVDESTWEKAWNNKDCFCFGIPIPEMKDKNMLDRM